MNELEVHDNASADLGSYVLLCLNGYAISKNILSGNGVQLRQLLKTLEDPEDPAKVWVWENREVRDALLGEVTRHFHNFLTSVTTLIDHTRNLMKEDFITEEHRKEHQKRVQETFAKAPLAIFVKELRHYMTHRAVPIIEMSHTIGNEDTTQSLDLDLERMAAWEGWTPPARVLIKQRGPAIRILDLIDEYERIAITFHEHFVRRFFWYYDSQIKGQIASLPQSLPP